MAKGGVKIKETTLIRVNSKSESLRTTVPTEIKKIFGLKEGSKIAWFYAPKDLVRIEVSSSKRNKGGGV
jgi:bifunctional DNA-binding transcriptional regulator/antitoxin component of YhaV-PrlF toxin-antitoxin module